MNLVLKIIAVIMLTLGGFAELGSIIYFAVELLNGAGFLSALWSAIKVFVLGTVLLILGYITFVGSINRR
jgi:hypothetical protein